MLDVRVGRSVHNGEVPAHHLSGGWRIACTPPFFFPCSVVDRISDYLRRSIVRDVEQPDADPLQRVVEEEHLPTAHLFFFCFLSSGSCCFLIIFIFKFFVKIILYFNTTNLSCVFFFVGFLWTCPYGDQESE